MKVVIIPLAHAFMKARSCGSMQLLCNEAVMVWLAHNSVATIVEREGLFLMVEETDPGTDGTVFNQPAGHLEAQETLFAAAVRETLEETAWRVALDALVGIYHYQTPNGVTYVRHCFAATPLGHDPQRPLDADIVAAHWLSAATILAPG